VCAYKSDGHTVRGEHRQRPAPLGFIISGIIIVIICPIQSLRFLSQLAATFPLLAAPHQKGANQVATACRCRLPDYLLLQTSRCVAVVKETLSEHTDQTIPGIVTFNMCLICAQKKKKNSRTAPQLYTSPSVDGDTDRAADRQLAGKQARKVIARRVCRTITRELAWLIEAFGGKKQSDNLTMTSEHARSAAAQHSSGSPPNSIHSNEGTNAGGRTSSSPSQANTSSNTGDVPRPKRIACVVCRKRKLRCDGTKPSCGTCSRLGHDWYVLSSGLCLVAGIHRSSLVVVVVAPLIPELA
jgi:hypothetical protein